MSPTTQSFLMCIIVLYYVVKPTDVKSNFGSQKKIGVDDFKPNYVESLLSLIRLYREEHSITAVRKDSRQQLCFRRYVRNFEYDLSCKSVGNSIGSYLSSMIVSIILNRTYVARRSFLQKCHGTMDMEKWIVRQDELAVLLKNANCSVDFNTRHDGSTRTKDLYKGLGSSDSSVISFDHIMNKAFDYFNPRTSRFTLSYAQKQRANTFFNMSVLPLSIARFLPYGILQSQTIFFTDMLRNTVNPILSSLSSTLSPISTHLNSVSEYAAIVTEATNVAKVVNKSTVVTIGVHMRHYNYKSIVDASLDLKFDSYFEEAIQIVRQRVSRTAVCVLLVASDRAASIQRVVEYAGRVDCRARFVSRNMSASASDDIHGIKEHGPWATSITSIADLYLLSHSDYFIGSLQSSFSYLIANAVSFRPHQLRKYSADSSASLSSTDESRLLWLSHRGLELPQ